MTKDKEPSKNAYSYSLTLAGQADAGGVEAAELVREAYEDMVTKLDKAGIPAGGTLTGKVEPARETPDGPALGEAVIHEAASDVLLRVTSTAKS